MTTTTLQSITPHRRGIWWSLGFIGLLFTGGLVLETGVRLLIPRMSRVEARTIREYQAALRPPNPSKTLVLCIGNSLMNAGVQFDQLQQGLGASIEVRRFLVEQTGSWDWFYGIRRLFSDGAKPAAVILMIGPHDLIAPGVRGDYFAYRLMRTKDIFDVASRLRLHPTVAANMFAANLSAFYGLRSEIRKVFLGRLMPDLPVLTHKLTTIRGPVIPPTELANIGSERLKKLDSVAKENQTRFIFVLIPGPHAVPEFAAPLQTAAGASGIPVVLACHNGQILPTDYSDGHHMNAQGATKYTDSLIPILSNLLNEEKIVSGHQPDLR